MLKHNHLARASHQWSIAIIPVILIMLLAACGSAPAGNGGTSTGGGKANCSPKISMAKLNLGLIPAENADKVLNDTKPFAAALEKELCVPIELYVGTSYTATIEALSSKKIDVAWFGPFSYVLASAKYNAEAFALQIGKNGEESYYSYIFTNKKTGITDIAGLRGRSFSFVDPASTSGHLVPRYMLVKSGLNPDKDLKPVFAGGHDASLLGVMSGKVDAGAVASDIYAKMLADGKFKEDDVVILKKSDPIPNSPIAYRKELNQSDKDAIKAAFITIKDPQALKAINTGGFKAVGDSTYDGLRDIARTLNLDLTKLK